MISRHFRGAVLVGGALLLSMAVVEHSVLAANKGLQIESVFVDFDAETITINGQNFIDRDPPVVTLGGFGELMVLGFTGVEIVAQLPLDTARGARPARPARGARTARPTRGARPARPARGARPARPTRGARTARPTRGDGTGRPSRSHRASRPRPRRRAGQLRVRLGENCGSRW
jgi:hypothetical protein